MIKLKTLLMEGSGIESLSSKDIFNFYYLWHIAVQHPDTVTTPFGKEVLNHYLKYFKTKYVKLFSKLLSNQISKYVKIQRIDPDFPREASYDNKSPAELWALMKKTFRSDMTRRNDRWIMVGEFVTNLSGATSSKEIFTWVNQLNNAVHNTEAKVMDKLPNFYGELKQAFDTISKTTNIEMLKGMVDKDIRDLKNQSSDEITEGVDYTECMGEGLEKSVFCEVHIDDADRRNPEFVKGLKQAVQDKAQDIKRGLGEFSPDFVRGYKMVKRQGWWDKANDKLTRWASDFGNSYGRR